MKYKKKTSQTKVGKIGDIKSSKKWAKKLGISVVVFEFYAFQNGYEKLI